LATSRPVKAWLAKASRDLRVGKALLELRPPFLAEAAFFSQQSIEKSLKAFILSKGRRIKKIHDLVTLYKEAVEAGYEVKLPIRRLASITRYAVSIRYPDATTRLTRPKVTAALALSKSIYYDILERV
jgi:HEPN domain-containing protein